MTWTLEIVLLVVLIVMALILIGASALVLWLDPGPGPHVVEFRPRDPAPMWRSETRPLELCRRCRRRNRSAR